eukprot:2066390-Rhodomonas_salina.1
MVEGTRTGRRMPLQREPEKEGPLKKESRHDQQHALLPKQRQRIQNAGERDSWAGWGQCSS